MIDIETDALHVMGIPEAPGYRKISRIDVIVRLADSNNARPGNR